MNLADEMAQVFQETVVARALYREYQAEKSAGRLTQDAVNRMLDDYEHLVRYYNLLAIKAKAEIHDVQLPEIDPDESVEEVRKRLYARLEKKAGKEGAK